MNCLKLFDERIMSRDPDRQTAEIQIRIAIMNRFSALEGPRSRLSPEKEQERRSCPNADLRNNAPMNATCRNAFRPIPISAARSFCARSGS